MQEKFKDLAVRLSNVGTVIALTSAILFTLNSAGIIPEFANEEIMNVVNGACAVLVILGILNNPQSSSLYVPFLNDNLNKKYNKK